MDFSQKRNSKFFSNKLLFRSVGTIFIIVVIVLVVADFKIYQKKRELDAAVRNYQQQIEDIKKSSQTLQDEIANADNVDYLERLGYEQFDQTRPGETEYMFVKSPQEAEVVLGPRNFWDAKTWGGWLVGAWQWIKSNF